MFPEELIAGLKLFFENSRDEDFSVSLRLMVAQAKLLSPAATAGVSTRALESRIYRLLQKWDYTWRRGTHKAQNTRHDVVIMEEANVAVMCGLFSAEDILGLIAIKPESVELIVTGRGADPRIIEKADLVTEMRSIKHYHDQGVQVRIGIET